MINERCECLLSGFIVGGGGGVRCGSLTRKLFCLIKKIIWTNLDNLSNPTFYPKSFRKSSRYTICLKTVFLRFSVKLTDFHVFRLLAKKNIEKRKVAMSKTNTTIADILLLHQGI
jgi:hypothetical protein